MQLYKIERFIYAQKNFNSAKIHTAEYFDSDATLNIAHVFIQSITKKNTFN